MPKSRMPPSGGHPSRPPGGQPAYGQPSVGPELGVCGFRFVKVLKAGPRTQVCLSRSRLPGSLCTRHFTQMHEEIETLPEDVTQLIFRYADSSGASAEPRY